MSERCAAEVWGGWHIHPCTRAGRVKEGGKWWCKQHVPSLAKARTAERDRKWQEKWDRQDKERAEAKAAQAEVQRRADCYPDLLAALKAVVECDGTKLRPSVLSKVYAAIKKAEEKR